MSEREDVAVRFRDRNYFGWNGKSLYKGYYSHLENIRNISRHIIPICI